MVEKLVFRIQRRGEEFKIPHHTSAAAAHDSNLPHCDSNMPHIKAICLIQLPLAFIPNTSNSSFVVAIYIYITDAIKRGVIKHTHDTPLPISIDLASRD